MRLQAVIPILMTLLLTSCGNELASNKNNLGTESNREDLEGDDTISSQMHRTPGEGTITYAREIERALQNITSNSYRKVPDVDSDFERAASTKSVEVLGRPEVECGNKDESVMNGISARIKDCVKQNKGTPNSTYSWSGLKYGGAGEGLWQLVANFGEKEIWLDTKTGMVWSDEKVAVNWCKASGSSQLGNQIDCSSLSDSTSVCVGKTTLWMGNDVEWRLPTRNDFLQADLDGIKLVFGKGITSKEYWTATLDSDIKTKAAWVYDLGQGTLSSASIEKAISVRCIGTPRP